MTAVHSVGTAVSTAGRPSALVRRASDGAGHELETDRHAEADHGLVDVSVDLGPDARDDGLGGGGRKAGRSSPTTVELARNAHRSVATSC